MPHLSFWILTFLMGLTFLQADIILDVTEAEGRHHSELRIQKEVSVLAKSAFAFVYNDNAKTTPDPAAPLYYLVNSQIVFNSQGPSSKISYDKSTGALTVPTTGIYEVAYSISPRYNGTNLALAVNEKEVRESRVQVAQRTFTKNTFILQLNQGDHVSLILPKDKKDRKGTSFTRSGGIGSSASLLIIKL
jgi:hypothetical protein